MEFRVQMAKDVGKTVAEVLPRCQQPVMEPKYDGWRCVVIRTATGVDVYKPSRNSDPSKCYTGQLPELEADLMALPPGTILDGELVSLRLDTETGAWINEFFNIHTAMRSKDLDEPKVRLARQNIRYIAFDIVQVAWDDSSRPIHTRPLAERRAEIQSIIDESGVSRVSLTIQTEATQENHDTFVALGFEGTVIKDASKPYAFGKRGHGFFKVKWVTTIDCVVMEVVMDGKGQHEGKAGRMRVGQYRDGVLTERTVVNCLDNLQRDDATRHPEKYVGRPIEVKVYGWHDDEDVEPEDATPRHPTPLRFIDGNKEASECVWSRT